MKYILDYEWLLENGGQFFFFSVQRQLKSSLPATSPQQEMIQQPRGPDLRDLGDPFYYPPALLFDG